MGSRILVVDDEPYLRRILTHILLRAGHQVECAEDGAEAWDRLSSKGEPDLVISDLMMPGLSGIDLVRRIRADRKSSVPFLLLTACDREAERRDAHACGADAFMSKPFCHRELLEQVTALLDGRPKGGHGR